MTSDPSRGPGLSGPQRAAGLSHLELLAVAFLFGVSGMSSLVYQVAWQRVLALHSGVGLYSIAMIAGAFMAGLGIGSHLGGVASSRVSPARALRIFAALEAGVGLFAAASPWLYYDVLYTQSRWVPSSALATGLLHLLALIVPTSLMGMTLPFLVRALVDEKESAGRRVALLYGANVLGASLGAMLTPWVFVRHLGLSGAIAVGAAGNLLVAAGAALVGFRRPRSPAAALSDDDLHHDPHDERAFSEGPAPDLGLWVALYAGSGFCALCLEVVWFRLVEVGVKATAFTFGTVLSLYLLGLGLGTLLGPVVLGRVKHPLKAFLTFQCCLLLSAAAAVFVAAHAPPDLPFYRWFFEYWGQRQGFKLGRVTSTVAVTRLYVVWPLFLYGVPTVLMGLSFSALQRAVHDDPQRSGYRVGILQAANIAGCLAGSLAAGLWALTALGTTGTLRALLCIGLAFAAVGFVRFGPRSRFGLLGAALLTAAFGLPGQETLWFRLHGLRGEPALLAEDATGLIALTETPPGQWNLWINGRSLSWIPFGGIHTQLGALPALVHPAPRRVAIIGLGSGDTAWAAAARTETQTIDVFELCAAQQPLLRRLVAGPRRLARFLDDPRVRIRIGDGRNALHRSEGELYDLIEADGLVPEVAYSGTLYSLEFFETAGRRLRPGGVMCTWAPTPRVMATFRRAFPHVLSFDDGRILVGSHEPLTVDVATWTSRLLSLRAYLGSSNTADVLQTLETARPLDAASADPRDLNHDLFPRDEFATPR